MKRISIQISVIIVALFCGLMMLTACGNKSKDLKEKYGVENAEPRGSMKSASGIPMVIDFSAAWCRPCQQLAPIYDALRVKYMGEVDLVSVDIDRQPELAQEYGIQSVPTLVFLSPEGVELSRSVGYVGEAELEGMINELQERSGH